MESAVLSDPQTQIGNSVVRLVRGDVTELEVDAFVYYAQPNLNLGAGFGGAIAVRGGASVQKELEAMVKEGPLAVGEAVISGAGKLKAEHIIHAVGPRFKEADTEQKLHRTMVSCLRLAEEGGLKTLAFPAMGSGYYGIPPQVSARVMLQAMRDHLSEGSGIQEILICVFDTPQFNAFQAALAATGGGEGIAHA